MQRWQKSLACSITAVEELADRFGIDPVPLQQVSSRYPFRITPHYASLIGEPGDPIWRQCVPDPLELTDDGQSADPLAEEELSPVPGLIHRYPDRAVWLVSNRCAVYCRFCMRKRQVGCGHVPSVDRQVVLDYLAATPAIRDLILSGGDPLLLADDSLAEILEAVRRIPHISVVRIGTRVPVTMPDRVTSRLCRILKRFHPLYVNLHFNHPREITGASARACALLADAGIPLGNQTVLLRGVNDSPEVMRELMTGLIGLRVRPYYIHQMDLVRGTAHFRVPLARGAAVADALRGHVSGLANPCYMVDLPGGRGKVPVSSSYVRREAERVIIRDYRGGCVDYPDLADE